MQLSSVKKLFDEAIDLYAGSKSTAAESPIVSLFFHWLKENNVRTTLDICEFGGAAGQLLKKIKKVYPNSRLTNVEITDTYKKYSVSPFIHFVKGSLLTSKFPDHAFDVLIIRDVLHHLIGKNYEQTLQNQKKGLTELRRLVRPGGAIFIEEISVTSNLISLILYFLSNINARIGIRIPFLQISPHSVILFFTPERLTRWCQDTYGAKNIRTNQFRDHHETWRFRLVHLGARIGKMLLLIESPKK
ncbi:MAG: methyltransferase domain-containing protein [Parcubacteria group bacterium]|nr:methyltransferase domain-containing protein [Parcubacteria group bacterium]